jgi:uncharacterized membrane protein
MIKELIGPNQVLDTKDSYYLYEKLWVTALSRIIMMNGSNQEVYFHNQ